MIFPYKKLRYYYWLSISFFKKNIKSLLISFVLGFFLLLFFITLFPYLVTLFNRKTERIGIVGRYTLSNLPDDIKGDLSNPLLTVNPNGEIIPILIKSYELLDQNKTYRFFLKSNLKWSDGDSFVAQDLHYNFKGVEQKIIDDSTVEFTLSQPLSTFPAYLTKPLFKNKTDGVAGLYELNNYYEKDGLLQKISFSPNKKNIPFKEYKFYDTESKLINAYKKGEIAFIMNAKNNTADIFSKWKNTKITRSVSYNQMLTLFFNTNSKIFTEKEAREALAYALPEIEEYGVPAIGPLSPLSWAYNTHLKKNTLDFGKATSLLNKVIEGQKKPEINFYTFYEYLDVAEGIKKNAEKIGLSINLKVVSYFPSDFDMLLTVWSQPPDPDQYYFWHSTQEQGNITHYKNVKIDKLLEDGRKTLNIDERKKIYADFQRILMDDHPALFMYYPYMYTIEKK